jgi:hypothetical protein
VHGITISSIGLWLLYQQQPESFDNLGAIIDLDINHSEICLCTKAFWLTSREIPIGSVQMQQTGYVEILKQWEVTQVNTGTDKLSGPVQSVYLTSSKDQAFVLGAELVKAQNELQIKDLLLTKAIPLARGVQWPKAMTEDGVSMASLAGIAFSTRTPPINLIPSTVRQAQEQRANQRQLVIAGIWVVAALISLGLALGIGFLRKNVRLAQLDAQLRDVRGDALQVEDRLKEVYDIEGMIKDRLTVYCRLSFI